MARNQFDMTLSRLIVTLFRGGFTKTEFAFKKEKVSHWHSSYLDFIWGGLGETKKTSAMEAIQRLWQTYS